MGIHFSGDRYQILSVATNFLRLKLGIMFRFNIERAKKSRTVALLIYKSQINLIICQFIFVELFDHTIFLEAITITVAIAIFSTSF